MTIDQLISLIPTNLEYSFTVQRLGYRYFCYLRIINYGNTSVRLNGSSNSLDVALDLIAEKLKGFGSTHKMSVGL